jgi:hypothetical protein
MFNRRVSTCFVLLLSLRSIAQPGDITPGTDLGVPITSANRISYKTAYGFGPGKLNLLCWTTTAESGGYFYALNITTRELKVHPLHHLEAYPIVFGTDGKVYVGSTSGEVLSWDPLSDKWGPLGPPIFNWPGSSLNHVRVLCEGRDGWLYAGSCYGERARINMVTRKIEKLPETPEEGHWYVSSVAMLPDGRIAFGYGYRARVFVYDPALGRDVGQWLPESWTKDGFCFNLLVGDRVLYATHFPSGRRGAIDASTGEFLGDIPWPPDSSGQTWSKWLHCSGHGSSLDFFVLPGTNAAITSDGNTIHRFDPTASPKTSTLAPEQLGLDPSLDLAIRFEVTSDCRILEYDVPHSCVMSIHHVEQQKVERNIFALGTGPDGKVYGGGYQSTLLFQHDPATGRTIVLGDHHPGWSGETYSYAVRGAELICASYTSGALVAYDPAGPWDCERGAMKNPRFLGFLGQQVYRPLSTCVSDDGTLWSVGPAGWGSVGGGIGRCDPDQKRITTTALEDIPHSILPLPGNRLLVCSDSLIRWWDAETDGLLAESKLTFRAVDACRSGRGADSVLLATGNGELIVVDVSRSGVIQLLKKINLPLPCSRVLAWDNRIVVGGEKGFATVDLMAGKVEQFCNSPLGSRWACTLAAGSVYFAKGSHLMKVPLPKP